MVAVLEGESTRRGATSGRDGEMGRPWSPGAPGKLMSVDGGHLAGEDES